MGKVITFIIPAYNAEPYLEKCLNSFWNEAVMDRIEVLIVNDGSTDQTARIAQCFTERRLETYKLINKENGGHGSAINIGSRLASGTYLKVIDADDWVVTENLAEFVMCLDASNADVVLTPFHMVHMATGKRKEYKLRDEYDSQSITLNRVVRNWGEFEEYIVFHGLTYKTSFYREQNYTLPEHIFYEDQIYSAIPCCLAKEIYIKNLFIYEYMIGNMVQSISVDNQLKRISHIKSVAEAMLHYYETNAELSEAGREFLREKIENVILIYYLTACIFEPNKRKGRDICRQYQTKLKQTMPELADKIFGKYRMYCLMNRLHISGHIYRKFVSSAFYRNVKRLCLKCS